jgi:hypothetical protein
MTATLSAPSSTSRFVSIRRAPTLEPPADDDRRRDDHPVCTGQLALFTSIQSARTGGGLTVSATGPVAQVGGAARPTGSPVPGAERPLPGAVAPGAVGPGAVGPGAVGPGAVGPGAVGPGARSVAGAAGPGDPATGPDPAAGSGNAVAGSGNAVAGSGNAVAGPAGTTPMAAQVAAGRFVAACVEVLNGFRPAAHLRALTTPFDYAAVVKQLTHRARIRVPPAPGSRVGLHRVRVFEQRAGVAEAVAVLSHGNVAWAIALRFEHRRGTWLCNLLEVV